jgi:hypothetical protein
MLRRGVRVSRSDREPERRDTVGELALYLAAGLVYVTLGVLFPEALFSWVEGAAFLLVAVVLLPALVRRLR